MDWCRMEQLKVFYDGKDRIGTRKPSTYKKQKNKSKKKLARRIKILAEANRIIKKHGLSKVRNPELKAAVLEQLYNIPTNDSAYFNPIPRVARALQYITDGTLPEISGARKTFSINDRLKEFYNSYDWKKLRYETILKYGRICMACGATNCVINVDHIKPPRFFWALRLDPNNVQILCSDCNHGKGNWDTTDWRKKQEYTDDIALMILDDLKK